MPNQVKIRVELFEKEAQDSGVTSFLEFYESKMFKAKHKIVDKDILCSL